jgi:flagellar basal body rod protein FlgB
VYESFAIFFQYNYYSIKKFKKLLQSELTTNLRRNTILENNYRQSNTPEFFPSEIQDPLHNPYVSKASFAPEDLSLQ